MGRMIVVLMISLVVLASGCLVTTDSQSAPGWVDSLYDRAYPEKTFLCAVGAGSTRENAVNAAFSSLSQVFSVRVESTISTYSSSSAVREGSEVLYLDSDSMIDQGSVSTQADRIIGVQVVNTWVEPSGTVWVRLAIDRAKGVRLYEQEMEELELRIAQARMQAAGSASPITRYFKLASALESARGHQQMLEQVKVLSGKPRPSILQPLERELDALASTIGVTLEVDAGTDAVAKTQLTAAFAALLTDYGFMVAGKGPRVLVEYAAIPVSTADSPYVHVRWSLAVRVTEGAGTIASYRLEQRETAMTEADARQRALRAAINAASSQFQDAFNQ